MATTTTPAVEPHPRALNETLFTDPKDRFWSMYLSEAQLQDKQRTDRWKGDADGILIFTGLFAATVATFVVASYPNLSPDTGAETVAILQQVAELLANQTQMTVSSSSSPAPSAAEWSGPALSDICVNALWFLSLIVSIIGALLATLVQQWSRQYSQDTQRRGSPSVRGPIHLLLSSGIETFRMDDALGVITSLIHVAVVLFFSGLLVFLYSLNHIVAWIAMGSLALAMLCYLLLSVLPLIYPDSPYQTPLTASLRFTAMVFAVSSAALTLLITKLFAIVTKIAHKHLALHNVESAPGLIRRDTMVPTETFLGALRVRVRPITRGRLSIMKESAKRPGTKSICRAIETLWQHIDEAREIADFCETILHFISQQDLRATDREDLSSFLLLSTNILAQVRGLISTMKPVPGKIPDELECNRRLATSVSLSTSLMRHYLKGNHLDASVLHAFMALEMDLVAFVPAELRQHCHLSTYYLSRFLLHEMMPETRAVVSELKSATFLRRLEIPNDIVNSLTDEIQYGCHSLDQSDIRVAYGTATQGCHFLDVRDVKLIYQLKTARAFDCELCRLALLLIDIMRCCTVAPQLLSDRKHIWSPTLQSLKDAIHKATHPEHVAYYLFAELLDQMQFTHGDDKPVKAFPATSTLPEEDEPNRHTLHAGYNEFLDKFVESDVAHMTYEHIMKKLGYRPLPDNWHQVWDSKGHMWFENDVTHEQTYVDPRIRPDNDVDENHAIHAPPGSNPNLQQLQFDDADSTRTFKTTRTHIETAGSVSSDGRLSIHTAPTHLSDSIAMSSDAAAEPEDTQSINTFWARDSEGSPLQGPATLV